MSDKKFISYEESGVSIDANDVMVDRISKSVKSTFGPQVIGLENGFAGLFQLNAEGKPKYKDPVLVSCTDGVGTKIIIAQQVNKFDSIGIDLVAMSVNDMIVQGAEPLFFLDYLAVNKLDPERVAEMVEGIAAGCKMAGCALIGGETAEMPDVYNQDEFDMAGFAVGVVEKDRIITGSDAKQGDVLLGLASSGVHSNGFSLARHICFKQMKLEPTAKIDELDGMTIADALLEPTKIYVKSVVGLLAELGDSGAVHAMAHITGGGLVGNIPRVLPDDCDAVIDKSSFEVPKIFGFMQKNGPVEEAEMFRVFNMGIGYVLAVDPAFADEAAEKIKASGETV
jgi:phosphoribosylformylglycinamidine cyclo-ligase